MVLTQIGGRNRLLATRRYILSTLPVLYISMLRDSGGTNQFLSDDGAGHICTVTGPTWGIHGRTFDGIDDDISVSATALNFTTENFTIACWIKPTTLAGATRTLVARSPIGTDGYLARVTDDGRIDFMTWSPGEGRTYTAINVILINISYLVTFVRDGTAAKLYRNGELIANEASGTHNNPASSNQSLLIGNSVAPGSAGLFIGTIGEAHIYNRALTASEIQRLYQVTKWRYK